jgi:3-phosphoshikimate 1-carboxyvinyltransferase
VDLVRAFGGQAEVDGDDLVVEGRAGPLVPAGFDSRGDHRMAMAAAIAGAACSSTGVTTVDGWDAVATSYPAFAADLAGLQSGGESSW